MNRIYCISDIHGCANTFEAILDKIGLNKDDTLYLLGDYIDRGPRSRAVLDKIIHLQNKGFQLHCLRGNHEQMMLEAPLDDECAAIWLRNGGAEVLQEFAASNFSDIPKKYFDFLDGLHYYIQTDDMLFVHAGFKIDPLLVFDPFNYEKHMLWIRKWEEQPGLFYWLRKRKVIHGHSPQIESEIRKRFDNFDNFPILNIDNGCAYERIGMHQLCCAELKNRKLFFQKNID